MGRARVEAGFSLIEVTVAVAVLTVSLFGLVSAMTYAVKQSTFTAELSIAQDAAQAKIEEIQTYDLRDIYALYDADASNDPAGLTAPGATFAVAGLSPRAGQTSCGRVIFPPVAGTPPNTTMDETPTPTTATAELGFPMDLDADGDAGDAVATTKLVRCPVKVRVEWRGAIGDAELEVCALVIRR